MNMNDARSRIQKRLPACFAALLLGLNINVSAQSPQQGQWLGQYAALYSLDGVRVVAAQGGALYAGGQFNTNNSSSGLANYLARWTTNGWDTVGGGLNGPVQAIAVVGSDVYVGGTFTQAGGVAANNIARWDGTTWHALGSGLLGAPPSTAPSVFIGAGVVNTLVTDGTNLFAGGAFTSAGSVSAQYAAVWDGSSWSPMGQINAPVNAMTYGNGRIYAASIATFTNPEDFTSTSGVVQWINGAWRPAGLNMGSINFGDFFAIAVNGSDIYVGGNFQEIGGGPNGHGGYSGGVIVNDMAHWDGKSWSDAGGGVSTPVYNGFGSLSEVLTLSFQGQNLYVGGVFSQIAFGASNQLDAGFVAKWDGTNWFPVGSPGVVIQPPLALPYVSSIAFLGGDVVVAGSLGQVGGLSLNIQGGVGDLARFDGTNWASFGSGVYGLFPGGLSGQNAAVSALATDGTNIYLGGNFTNVAGNAASGIACLTGLGVSGLNGGMDGPVQALLLDGANLYAGGGFSKAGGAGSPAIARWDGTNWHGVGGGLNGTVYALAKFGGQIVAAGDFHGSGNGSSPSYLAIWDGAAGGSNPTTNSTITTNVVSVISTNNTVAVTTNAATASSFGTINTLSEAVVDRFAVPPNLKGLTYDGSDAGYAATEFYSMRQSDTNAALFDTIIATTQTTTDRFNAGNQNFDALTYAAGDLGYGPLLFYYLRHDNAGVSTFGSITPGGVVGVTADHFVVGNNFDALTYTATDVGYGANLFYYVRHDATGLSTFGTINPALPGTITDRFTVGTNVDALVFTDLIAPGYGPNNFYYLRHDAGGVSTFGTISVTGPATATVTDRFPVGTNATALTFTATDAGSFGPNLFYYLRGGAPGFTTNLVTTFSTNTVTTFITNTVSGSTTNGWSAAGGGVDGPVYSLLVNGGILYAGGVFAHAGGAAANSVAQWDGANWSALGSGLQQGGLLGAQPAAVYCLATLGANVYAGGLFSLAGGAPAAGTVAWNGSQWSALGSGLGQTILNLLNPPTARAMLVANGNLYVTGENLSLAGGSAVSGLAVWTGTNWLTVPQGLQGYEFELAGAIGSGYALTGFNGEVVIGGAFGAAGGLPASGLAAFLPASSAPIVITPASPPALGYVTGAAGLTLSWDAAFLGFTLESSATLAAGSWTAVPGSSLTNSIAITPAAAQSFFRLRQ
jgi:hypothetical protein